jgi:LysR family transcriptional regulator, hydrogen peroxide-inducible genes activator
MNLQQFEYIVALDNFKSFSKAAEHCYITQATLSTMVKKLEIELDTVIFDRTANPIITTDAGKEIVEEAKKILFHSQNLKQKTINSRGKTEGELKIGIIPTIAGSLLPRLLPVIFQKYPKFKLLIKEVTTQTIVQQLKSGELDAAIVSTPLEKEELEEEILYYEKLLVYGKLSHSKTKFALPKDLNKEKVWLLEEGNCLSNQIINICSLNKKQLHENLDFKPTTFETLLNLVDKLSGLTLIPELYYLDLPEDKKSKVIDFQAPYPVREISIVFHRPYTKIKLVNALAKEIRQNICPILKTSQLKNSELLIANM